MSDKILVGDAVTDITVNKEYLPISKVVLWYDDNQYFVAGDDSGGTFENDNPFATQQMADNILAALKGFVYKPFQATDASLDPAFELGDGVTINRNYGMIADVNLGSAGLSSVSAPGETEIESEYGYTSQSEIEFDRTKLQMYSLISKTSEEIKLYVANEIDGVESTITQTADSLTAEINAVDGRVTRLSASLDSIEAKIQDVEGNYASLTISVNELSSTVSSYDGQFTTIRQDINGLEITTSGLEDVADGLSNGTTLISGGCIRTGQISADRIDTSELVAERIGGGNVELLNGSGRSVGNIAIASSSSAISGQGVQINAPAVGLIATSGDIYAESRGTATYLHINTSNVVCKGPFIPTGSGNWNLGSSSQKWANVYATNGTIQTSDRNQKTAITYGLDSYNDLFDGLRPCSYKMADGGKRTHLGLISQDVESEMLATGISDMDFAGFIKSENEDGTYDYALRYSEFIPMLIDQIQKLKGRVSDLEAKA